MHLGEKLKLYRKKKAMDQPEMAVVLGVGYRTYQEIERTGRITKADIKEKVFTLLAETLNTQVAQKMAETEDKDKTIFNLSEAQILLARAIYNMTLSYGTGGAGPSSDQEGQKGNVSSDVPLSGNKGRKKKQGDI